MDKEIVLPNGQFAAIRRPIMLDLIMAYDVNTLAMMSKLAIRLVKIDGVPLTSDSFFGMYVTDAMPIVTIIGDMINVDNKVLRGVS